MPVPQRARSTFQALEATFDDETLRARVTLIRPGMSGNRKNWTAAALKKASESGFWNGARMFIDHVPQTGALPTKKKSRSLKDMVSAVESTEVAEDGRIVGTVQFFDEKFYSFAKRAKDYMGTSVDLLFKGELISPKGEQPYYAVEELVVNNSVDWVVDPAAGGKIDEFLTAHEGEDNVEWSEVTADMLRQHRPDLIPALEGSGNPPAPPVVGLTEDQVAAITKKAIHEARESWDSEHRTVATVNRQISEHVRAAKLPEKITNRLIATFDGATTFDQAAVDAALKEAREELEDAGIKPRINGAGNSQGSGGSSTQTLAQVAPVHAALESVFHRKPSGTKTTEGGND